MVRDLNLEAPCKNMKCGCEKRNHLDAIEDHEAECEYRPLFLGGEAKPFQEYLDDLKESQCFCDLVLAHTRFLIWKISKM